MKPPADPDRLVELATAHLSAGEPVDLRLPGDGRLRIDRPLPFLVVYRRPARRPDAGTERLVAGEASYLIGSGRRRHRPLLAGLIRGVTEVLSERFGCCLLIELWSALADPPADAAPGFRLLVDPQRPPHEAIDALTKGLGRIRIAKRSARVAVEAVAGRRPPGLPVLLPAAAARRLECYRVGLELTPVHRDPASGEPYPLVLRALHRGLAGALKRGAFAFARGRTGLRPAHFQALGPRALVKAVRDADRRLAAIDRSFDFLLQLTPVDADAAWRTFKRRGCQRAPILHYRPLPVDPAHAKRELYAIPLERIEDPVLADLMHEKRLELDRQLTLLWDRGRRTFLAGSRQLYGDVEPELAATARALLAALPPRSRDRRGGTVGAAAFARRAEEELARYREAVPDLPARVEVRADTTGLMVSHGDLLIGRSLQVPAGRVEAMLAHEIGTHVLTWNNGRAQPLQLLQDGLPGYDELQEGLAVLAEYLVGGLSRARLRLLAARVVAVDHLVGGATFVDIWRALTHEHGLTQEGAFGVTVRVFRGGGLTKDAIYLRGLVGLLAHLAEGGDLEELYLGKIALSQLPFIRALRYRRLLYPPPLRPRHLADPGIADRLAALRDGLTPLDLVATRRGRRR